ADEGHGAPEREGARVPRASQGDGDSRDASGGLREVAPAAGARRGSAGSAGGPASGGGAQEAVDARAAGARGASAASAAAPASGGGAPRAVKAPAAGARRASAASAAAPASGGGAPRAVKNEAGRPRATVSDYTERDLIARIQQRLPPAPDWLLVGIGDDAAVVEPEPNRVEVLSVDAIVDGVHVDRAFVPPEAIGHRALAVNLSDLAAMGALPRLSLLSMALPPSLPLDDYDGIANGIAQLAAAHRLHVVGGNLTKSPGPLAIDVTVVGTVKRRQALRRS